MKYGVETQPNFSQRKRSHPKIIHQSKVAQAVKNKNFEKNLFGRTLNSRSFGGDRQIFSIQRIMNQQHEIVGTTANPQISFDEQLKTKRAKQVSKFLTNHLRIVDQKHGGGDAISRQRMSEQVIPPRPRRSRYDQRRFKSTRNTDNLPAINAVIPIGVKAIQQTKIAKRKLFCEILEDDDDALESTLKGSSKVQFNTSKYRYNDKLKPFIQHDSYSRSIGKLPEGGHSSPSYYMNTSAQNSQLFESKEDSRSFIRKVNNNSSSLHPIPIGTQIDRRKMSQRVQNDTQSPMSIDDQHFFKEDKLSPQQVAPWAKNKRPSKESSEHFPSFVAPAIRERPVVNAKFSIETARRFSQKQVMKHIGGSGTRTLQDEPSSNERPAEDYPSAVPLQIQPKRGGYELKVPKVNDLNIQQFGAKSLEKLKHSSAAAEQAPGPLLQVGSDLRGGALTSRQIHPIGSSLTSPAYRQFVSLSPFTPLQDMLGPLTSRVRNEHDALRQQLTNGHFIQRSRPSDHDPASGMSGLMIQQQPPSSRESQNQIFKDVEELMTQFDNFKNWKQMQRQKVNQMKKDMRSKVHFNGKPKKPSKLIKKTINMAQHSRPSRDAMAVTMDGREVGLSLPMSQKSQRRKIPDPVSSPHEGTGRAEEDAIEGFKSTTQTDGLFPHQFPQIYDCGAQSPCEHSNVLVTIDPGPSGDISLKPGENTSATVSPTEGGRDHTKIEIRGDEEHQESGDLEQIKKSLQRAVSQEIENEHEERSPVQQLKPVLKKQFKNNGNSRTNSLEVLGKTAFQAPRRTLLFARHRIIPMVLQGRNAQSGNQTLVGQSPTTLHNPKNHEEDSIMKMSSLVKDHESISTLLAATARPQNSYHPVKVKNQELLNMTIRPLGTLRKGKPSFKPSQLQAMTLTKYAPVNIVQKTIKVRSPKKKQNRQDTEESQAKCSRGSQSQDSPFQSPVQSPNRKSEAKQRTDQRQVSIQQQISRNMKIEESAKLQRELIKSLNTSSSNISSHDNFSKLFPPLQSSGEFGQISFDQKASSRSPSKGGQFGALKQNILVLGSLSVHPIPALRNKSSQRRKRQPLKNPGGVQQKDPNFGQQILQGVKIQEQATDTRDLKDLDLDSILDSKSCTENVSMVSRTGASILKDRDFQQEKVRNIKILKIVKSTSHNVSPQQPDTNRQTGNL